MLAKYDQDVVKNLMPLIVNVLGKTVFHIRMFAIQYGICISVQAVQLKVTCYKKISWKTKSSSTPNINVKNLNLKSSRREAHLILTVVLPAESLDLAYTESQELEVGLER